MQFNGISNAKRTPRCIVIADDLTGACDSGLEFARAGLSTLIAFGKGTPPCAEVLVVSTDSRRMSPQLAFIHVTEVANRLPLREAEIVFKKIDSTLRGNIFEECEAVRQAAHLSFGIVVPALPSQGRVMENGVLQVTDLTGSWKLDVYKELAGRGASVVQVQRHSLAEHIDGTAHVPYALCDASNDEDLAAIAAALTRPEAQSVLWIGSAGFAKQAANHLRNKAACSSSTTNIPLNGTEQECPILLCVGSDHPVTQRQLSYLLKQRSCYVVREGEFFQSALQEAISNGMHIVLKIDMREPDCARLRCILEQLPVHAFGGVFLTGGDTAALVCSAASADQLWLQGQIRSGIALGRILGGIFASLPVATKSGGFGTEHCLVESVDYLSTAERTGDAFFDKR